VREIHVGIGEAKVSRDPRAALAVYGLGSCVCVCLWGKSSRVAGMAHVLLPIKDKNSESSNGNAYADVIIEKLLVLMEKRGADRKEIIARIAGGANILSGMSGKNMIGSRNTHDVIKILTEMKVPILEKDLGGEHGRTVRFFVENGKMTVVTRKQKE